MPRSIYVCNYDDIYIDIHIHVHITERGLKKYQKKHIPKTRRQEKTCQENGMSREKHVSRKKCREKRVSRKKHGKKKQCQERKRQGKTAEETIMARDTADIWTNCQGEGLPRWHQKGMLVEADNGFGNVVSFWEAIPGPYSRPPLEISTTGLPNLYLHEIKKMACNTIM